jgi:YidC/Oxa1 family membrane protein insertase
VERRYALFIALSLAIVLASQALQFYFFPKPPAVEAGKALPDADIAAAGAGEPPADMDEPRADAASPDRGNAAEPAAAVESQPAPRARLTLGSLDPAAASRMLVTLTSRGAAVERVELAGGQFLDQDDRSGYLGHLAVAAVEQGCRIGVVGRGTPADRAGLMPSDVITTIDGLGVADPRTLHGILARAKPGQAITINLLRDGAAKTVEATLGRRPLEVVRPEFKTLPVVDPDVDPADPLSFRLSLEARDAKRRGDAAGEIAGQELDGVDWAVDPASDAGRVRFTRRLPGGLTVAKEYTLAPDAADAGDPRAAYRLALTVEFTGGDAATTLAYALDGPTGLPTEGWWYTARVARDWGSLAVRDVAMRFAGESTTLVSGLKMADGSLDHPATAVLEGKPLSFAGVDALYFAAALVPAASGPDAPVLEEVRPLVAGDIPEAARRKLIDVTCRLVAKQVAIEPGATLAHRYEIFAGPKKPDLLAGFGAAGAAMDDLVYYGWFGWVARPMIAILHAIHAVVGNYGIAILLLTVAVRGGMFPVSRKQAISSQKMQVLQPEMKAIAEKYKNEPEKRTRATQELWRKHDYNPMGGCLLVFIQIPIFMGLYRSLATDVELRQAPLFSSAIRWCSNLAAPDMFLDWSRYLPAFLTAPEGWLGPFLNLFPLATIGLFLWQQKLFMPPAVDEQAQMQQQVMKYMMWFMALMFFKVPCGLCLYFIASSLWGIAERLVLPQAVPAAAGAAPPSPSSFSKTIDAVFSATGNGPTVPAAKAAAARQKRQARKKR